MKRWIQPLRAALLTAGVIGACLPGAAQAAAPYPNRPITLLVPYPAGASTDSAARQLAPELSKQLGKNVIVENVGGAGGALAVQRLLRSPADGYTLLLGTNNETVLVPLVNRAIGYQTAELQAVGKVGSTASVLVAKKDLDVDTIDALVAKLKKTPNSLSMGHPGVGTFQHLIAASIAQQAGVEWTHIPYKGASPLLTDLLGGQIELAVITLPSAAPHLANGRLKSLGLIRDARDPQYPELATINEGTALKAVHAELWLGLFGPKDLAKDVTDKISAALQQVLAQQTFRDAQLKIGFNTPETTSAKAFAAYLAQQVGMFKEIAASVKLD